MRLAEPACNQPIRNMEKHRGHVRRANHPPAYDQMYMLFPNHFVRRDNIGWSEYVVAYCNQTEGGNRVERRRHRLEMQLERPLDALYCRKCNEDGPRGHLICARHPSMMIQHARFVAIRDQVRAILQALGVI